MYQFAESIYGLPLYLVTNFLRGVAHMCCPGFRIPVTSASVAVRTHIAFGLPSLCGGSRTHAADILTASGGAHEDLVHLSLKNGLFISPYYVALEHPSKTQIDIPGLPDGVPAFTHAGMLRTAKNIKNDLERRGILRDLVGAGVATLLAYLLRTTSHPNTIVYAYSPPGCMITAEALPYFETFCTSIVLGSDLVPRLSRATVENLKHEVARAVRSCDRHKLEVIGGFLWSECCGGAVVQTPRAALGDAEMAVEHVVAVEEELEGDEGETVGFLNGEDSGSSSRTRMEGKHPATYLPGRILYFRKERAWGSENSDRASTDSVHRHTPDLSISSILLAPFRWWKMKRERRLSGRRDTYRPVWAHAGEFQEIVISLTMGQDHMPNNLMTVMERVERVGVSMGREEVLPGVAY
ncbi:hypothetical protein HDV00_007539 [Rhizophlyctis rosea]|nr:hypothetical protein HDV00_007539 [Rhizophlyctis rosea]